MVFPALAQFPRFLSPANGLLFACEVAMARPGSSAVLNPAPNSTAAESHIHTGQMITTAMLPGGRGPA